jgi:hypothetical protein
MIVMSLQTKLGDKVSIIVERISDMWNGTSSEPPAKKNKKGNLKVSQPISGNNQILPPPIQTQSYNDGTSIGNLPIDNLPSKQQLPNYNNMYTKDTTPLVDATTPGNPYAQAQTPKDNSDGGVVPASEFGGFGGFSSW